MEPKIVVKEQAKESFRTISKHELRLVKAIAEGMTTREIAMEMGISYRTVESHRHNLLKRLNCKNLPHLVAVLFRQNLLS